MLGIDRIYPNGQHPSTIVKHAEPRLLSFDASQLISYRELNQHHGCGQSKDREARKYCGEERIMLERNLLTRTAATPGPQTSKDGDSFPVPVPVAKMSELVKSMMEGTFW
jgi:hypothetical protein